MTKTGSQAGRGDGGQSLIEIIIASALFAVVITVVLAVLTQTSQVTNGVLNNAQATDTAQVSVNRVSSYVQEVVSPMVAVVAQGKEGAISLTTTSPCWGTTSPAPTTNGVSVASPARLAIVAAYDFQMTFCGYFPGSTVPHVFQVAMSNTPSSTCTGDYGRCTLQVIDEGTSCNPGSGTGCSTTHVVAQINNVWCDGYCQGTHTGSAGTNPGGQKINRACIDVPGNTTATCSSAEPPLFGYYSGNPGQYSSSASDVTQSLNYSVENTESSTGTLPAACNGFSLFMDLYQNSGGTCPDLSGDLAGINLVVTDLTVLNNLGGTSKNPTVDGKNGSQFNSQVWLPNQLSSTYASTNTIVEAPGQPVGFYKLNDSYSSSGSPFASSISTSTSLNGTIWAPSTTTPTYDTLNSASVGPVSSDKTSGGIGLQATASAASAVVFPSSTFAAGTLLPAGGSATFAVWVDATGQSANTQWPVILSTGAADYSGINLQACQETSTGYGGWTLDVAVHGASANSQVTSSECPSGGYTYNTWHLVVGVVTPTTATVYVDGVAGNTAVLG